MRRALPSITVIVLSALFWGFAAGFLPLPTFALLGERSDPANAIPFLSRHFYWLLTAAAVAGCVGGVFAWQLRCGRTVSWSRGLVLWLGTGLAGLAAGQGAGGMVNDWLLSTSPSHTETFGLAEALGSALGIGVTFLGFGSIPVAIIGLVSYAPFHYFRKYACGSSKRSIKSEGAKVDSVNSRHLT